MNESWADKEFLFSDYVIATGYTFCFNKNFIKRWCHIEVEICGRYFGTIVLYKIMLQKMFPLYKVGIEYTYVKSPELNLWNRRKSRSGYSPIFATDLEQGG